jgi:hypothetical protein
MHQEEMRVMQGIPRARSQTGKEPSRSAMICAANGASDLLPFSCVPKSGLILLFLVWI